MLIKVLKSKLHRACVTDTKLQYPGSILIDRKLMDAAGIVPYEAVLVANLRDGSRFETYAVPADAGSGEVVVLGAAAHRAKPGDRVIILAFAFCTPDEARGIKPRVVVLDEANKVQQV